MDSLVPPVEERKSTSFLGRHKFTLISVAIIILALIPLLIISQHNRQPAPTTQITAKAAVTPTVAPLTQQNAEPTLDAVDNKIQTALDQSNTDLQQAAQVNTSGDSTAGL